MIDWSAIGAAWWLWAWSIFWQSTVLIGVIAIIDLLIRRWAWPQVRLALWSLVAIKLLLPPSLHLPTSMTAHWLDRGATPFIAQGIAHTLDTALSLDPGAQALLERAMTKRRGATAENGEWAMAAMVLWASVALGLMAALALRMRWTRGAFLAEPAAPGRIAELLHQAQRRVGVRRPVTLVSSERVSFPTVFGLMRPVVVLPAAPLASLKRDDVLNILTHELAHVRRGDLWLQTLLSLLQCIFWFVPLLPLARRRIYEVQELCCDLTVAGILREQTPGYARTLIEAARVFLSGSAPLACSHGFFSREAAVLSRLRALEGAPWRESGARRALAALLTLGVFLAAAPMGATSSDYECELPEVQCHGVDGAPGFGDPSA